MNLIVGKSEKRIDKQEEKLNNHETRITVLEKGEN